MVRKGIFKYTANGVYKYGFLRVWILGLVFFSKAALMVALFQHIYIWVHFYFTELPDLKFIPTSGFNTLPIAIGTASKYKRLFPFNASWACLAGQAGLPRGNLLMQRIV